MENFDIVGRPDGRFTSAQNGIHIGNNAGDIVIVNAKIDNFRNGIFFKAADSGNFDRSFVVVNPHFKSTTSNYSGLNSTHDLVLSSAETMPGRFGVQFDQASPYYCFRGHICGPNESAEVVIVTGVHLFLFDIVCTLDIYGFASYGFKVKSDGLSNVRIPPIGL